MIGIQCARTCQRLKIVDLRPISVLRVPICDTEEKTSKQTNHGGFKTRPPALGLGPVIVTQPMSKAGSRVLNPPCLFCFVFSSLWLISTLETLIGLRALYSNHVLLLLGSLFSVELMAIRLLWFWLAMSVRSTSR